MSQPDEGSIAEKEDGAVGGEYNGKEMNDLNGEGDDEKFRGFFSPEVVEKELAELRVSQTNEEGLT
jgi:hypothetical protein